MIEAWIKGRIQGTNFKIDEVVLVENYLILEQSIDKIFVNVIFLEILVKPFVPLNQQIISQFDQFLSYVKSSV